MLPQAQVATLPKADNKTGYFGVYHHPGKPKPYQAQVKRGGKSAHLGRLASHRRGGGAVRCALFKRARL